MGLILLTFQRRNSRQITSGNLNEDFNKYAIVESIFGVNFPSSLMSPQQQQNT